MNLIHNRIKFKHTHVCHKCECVKRMFNCFFFLLIQKYWRLPLQPPGKVMKGISDMKSVFFYIWSALLCFCLDLRLSTSSLSNWLTRWLAGDVPECVDSQWEQGQTDQSESEQKEKTRMTSSCGMWDAAWQTSYAFICCDFRQTTKFKENFCHIELEKRIKSYNHFEQMMAALQVMPCVRVSIRFQLEVRTTKQV